MKGRLVKEQQRLAGMQRSREAFLAVWQANRSRARAMRTMQRHIQSRTIRRLQRTNQVSACPSHEAFTHQPIEFCRFALQVPIWGGCHYRC